MYCESGQGTIISWGWEVDVCIVYRKSGKTKIEGLRTIEEKEAQSNTGLLQKP